MVDDEVEDCSKHLVIAAFGLTLWRVLHIEATQEKGITTRDLVRKLFI